MRRARRCVVAVAVAAAAIAVPGCGSDTPTADKATTHYGADQALGNGSIRTYVQVDGSGNPTELGIRIDEAALDGLPMPVGEPTGPPLPSPPIALPEQAKATAIDHLTLDWVPHGHPPIGVFDKPHFDAHFFIIDQPSVLAIDPTDPEFLVKAARDPASRYMPAGFQPIPGPREQQAIPAMGVHWVDDPSQFVAGQYDFDQILLNGAWDGRYAFIEPMFTREWLLTKPTLQQDVPQPQAYQRSGLYPTTYSIRYDDTSREYVIALGGMRKQEAT